MRPDLVLGLGSEKEARMLASNFADDLGSAVHYALDTTHAIAVCPFHLDLTIRIGDDAAERGQGRRSEHRYLRFPDLRAECGGETRPPESDARDSDGGGRIRHLVPSPPGTKPRRCKGSFLTGRLKLSPLARRKTQRRPHRFCTDSRNMWTSPCPAIRNSCHANRRERRSNADKGRSAQRSEFNTAQQVPARS